MLPSGRQTTIANRTYWALAHLNKAGIINRIARVQYEVSDRGRTVLANAPVRITLSYLNQFPEFVLFRTPVGRDAATSDFVASESAAQSATPEERLEAAGRDLKAEVAATLLTRLQALSPTTFEQLIIDVMLPKKDGWCVVREISEDVLGLDTIYLQAKRYAEDNTVGAPAIQGFAGALLQKGASKGVFVTTGRFSAQAVDVARGYTTHRIVLIDGRKLASLMVEHEVGVRTTHTIRVQRVALEAYEDGEAD